MPSKPRKPPRRKHYDGPPGYLRLHEGGCPRAMTSDGECSCWRTAEVVRWAPQRGETP